MARAMLLIIVALLPFSASQTVKSCGGTGDHLGNAVFTVSPDPVVAGQPLTFELTGELDEDMSELIVDLDLGIVVPFPGLKLPHVIEKVRITGSPKIPKGPLRASVGPVNLHFSALGFHLSGHITLNGTIKFSNAQGEAVGCLDIAELSLGATSKMEVNHQDLQADDAALAGQSTNDCENCAWSCGTAADHVQNLEISANRSYSHVTGTSDEAFTEMQLKSTTVMTYTFGWYFHASVTLSVSSPISLTPGIPAGPFELITEVLSELPAKVGLTSQGNLTLDDAKGERMACVEYAGATAAVAADAVVV